VNSVRLINFIKASTIRPTETYQVHYAQSCKMYILAESKIEHAFMTDNYSNSSTYMDSFRLSSFLINQTFTYSLCWA